MAALPSGNTKLEDADSARWFAIVTNRRLGLSTVLGARSLTSKAALSMRRFLPLAVALLLGANLGVLEEGHLRLLKRNDINKEYVSFIKYHKNIKSSRKERDKKANVHGVELANDGARDGRIHP